MAQPSVLLVHIHGMCIMPCQTCLLHTWSAVTLLAFASKAEQPQHADDTAGIVHPSLSLKLHMKSMCRNAHMVGGTCLKVPSRR